MITWPEAEAHEDDAMRKTNSDMQVDDKSSRRQMFETIKGLKKFKSFCSQTVDS